jgi:hypothetical protein
MPLNGTKIHPLSAHAKSTLDSIARSPRPSQEVNPGVVRRLTDESLVEVVRLPSPYKKHKGEKIAHLQITDAGRQELAKG